MPSDFEDFMPFAAEVRCGLMENTMSTTNTTEQAPVKGRPAKTAAQFGEDNTSFVWFPYIPRRDYTVLMADGGTGKTIFACGVAAEVSTGRPLPGDVFDVQPENVLFISAEDTGEVLKKRLALSGADLNRVYIIDCVDSVGLNFSDGYDEFEATVMATNPGLVIIDPWHGFLGPNVDLNRVNAMRPVLQRLASLTKKCNCGMVLISHVNKRAQGENANNAATGSTDFINASRSALRVIFDDNDPDTRVVVHTKSNYAGYGQSVRYRINDGGLEWDGFSDVTKQTLEKAARRRTTPWEVMQTEEEHTTTNTALIYALEDYANADTDPRISYDDFKRKYGATIFGATQPMRALKAVKDQLENDGYYLRTGVQVYRNKRQSNGFVIQKVEIEEPEQTTL